MRDKQQMMFALSEELNTPYDAIEWKIEEQETGYVFAGLDVPFLLLVGCLKEVK